jgi:hypothetical protein
VILFYGAVLIFVVGVLGLIDAAVRLLGAEADPLSARRIAGGARHSIVGQRAAAGDEKLEYMGIRKSVVGLVIPTGYSFNLDAFSIYLTLARCSSPRPPIRRWRWATCSASWPWRWSRRRARMAFPARRS